MSTKNDPNTTNASNDEVARLKDERDALEARSDQMLDLMAEMQLKLTSLEASVSQQSAPAGPVDLRSEVERQLASELEEISDEFAGFPSISILERRMSATSDVTDADDGIRLKDDPVDVSGPDDPRRKWKLSWGNLDKEGRSESKRQEGWVKVTREQLADGDMVPQADTVTDAYVRRGDRGREYLYHMPMKAFLLARRIKAARKAGHMQSEAYMRDATANKVAAMAMKAGDNGDAAGSFVHDPKQVMLTVKEMPSERVTIGRA